jgi:ribosomal protein S18 acetylase RimI-like enzyme
VRQLLAADLLALEECLGEAPLDNVYLRSELRHGALRQGALYGVEHPSHPQAICAAALLGPLVVPWAPAPRDLAALAEALRPRAHLIQLMVGPRNQIALLQKLLGRQLRPPRLLRSDQPHYAITNQELGGDWEPAPMRQATLSDFDQVMMAGAAMHLEEVGFDPMRSDPDGYRQRVQTLIRRGWIHIWVEDGRLAFKAECAAVTAEAIQLQGVWTRPDLRGRGLGTRGMATLCRQLLTESQAVTLFVNDFNHSAIRVYERVGFRRIGIMRSVLF